MNNEGPFFLTELNTRFWAIVDANWSYEEICALVDYCKRVEDRRYVTEEKR